VIPTCRRCGVDLGPWEAAEGCITCRGCKPRSIADRALAVLEQIDQPLPYWDVRRLMQVDGAHRVHEASLKAVLATDKRMCWAGPGTYGLFRHGLLPWVRDLSRVGGIYLHAADSELNLVQLAFVLRHVGYAFREISLRSALWRGLDLGIYRAEGVSSWSSARDSVPRQQRAAREIGLRRGPLFYSIVDRVTQQVEDGLRELERRQT
jgi:hypothetical protein